MKKISKTTKAFIMASAMALTLLLPTTTNAQTRIDGLFSSSNSSDYVERANYSGDIANQTFGQNFGFGMGGIQPQESPVGSGLIIMAIAGAGYALLKKKED